MVTNIKITEEIELHPRTPVKKYQEMEDLDDKKALNYSEVLSNNMEKIREDFVAPSDEIDKK